MFEILLSSSLVSFELKATFITVLCASSVVSLSLAWQVDGHTGEACKQAHIDLIYTLGGTPVVGAGHDRHVMLSPLPPGEAVMAAPWAYGQVDRSSAVVPRTML